MLLPEVIIFVEMSLFIASLNSGSNGNCYYVGNNNEAVLIDAGISCRETEKRMKLIGLSMKTVKAIFVSHEHTDHVKGVQGISSKFSLPVYITGRTLKSCWSIHAGNTKQIRTYVPVTIGELTVTAFPKHHDAEDPHSFIIKSRNTAVGVFTDIGACCEHVTRNFKECHAAFLEANYDEELLNNGRYPYFLKNRIKGGKGHLSNTQALEIFLSHRPRHMSHLLLSHLSKDNNCPDKVKALFNPHAGETYVEIASRYHQTQVFHINPQHVLPVVASRPLQMSLFEN